MSPDVVEVTAWYLAGKVEECTDPSGTQIRGVDIKGIAKNMSQKKAEDLYKFAIQNEMALLAALDFDLLCYHPLRPALGLLELASKLPTWPMRYGQNADDDQVAKKEFEDAIFNHCASCYSIDDLIFEYSPSILGTVAVYATATRWKSWGDENKTLAGIALLQVLNSILRESDEVIKQAREKLVLHLVSRLPIEAFGDSVKTAASANGGSSHSTSHRLNDGSTDEFGSAKRMRQQ